MTSAGQVRNADSMLHTQLEVTSHSITEVDKVSKFNLRVISFIYV